MKNLLVILFFSLFSLFSLVVMIFLVFLPKLCFCLRSFCNKNYKTVKKQNTRARRIKRARLRLLFKDQISHERPIQKEIDRSEGVFFDEKTQQRIKDEGSLARFDKGSFERVSTKQVIFNGMGSAKQKLKVSLISVFTIIRESVVVYYVQLRDYLSASVEKYLNH